MLNERLAVIVGKLYGGISRDIRTENRSLAARLSDVLISWKQSLRRRVDKDAGRCRLRMGDHDRKTSALSR